MKIKQLERNEIIFISETQVCLVHEEAGISLSSDLPLRFSVHNGITVSRYVLLPERQPV